MKHGQPKRIRAYDATTGEMAGEFASLTDACTWLGGYAVSNLSTHISKHKPQQIHGYVFKTVRRSKKTVEIDWSDYVKFIFWAIREQCKSVSREFHTDACEYVLGYIGQHLPQYKGDCKPTTHIKRSAEWGLLQWWKLHYRSKEELLDDDAWKIVSNTIRRPPDEHDMDTIIAEMPRTWQKIATYRLDGYSHAQIRRFLSLDENAYDNELSQLRRWLKGDDNARSDCNGNNTAGGD